MKVSLLNFTAILYVFREKLVPQESQDLRVKTAKMDPLGNLVQMDFQELLEKG